MKNRFSIESIEFKVKFYDIKTCMLSLFITISNAIIPIGIDWSDHKASRTHKTWSKTAKCKLADRCVKRVRTTFWCCGRPDDAPRTAKGHVSVVDIGASKGKLLSSCTATSKAETTTSDVSNGW